MIRTAFRSVKLLLTILLSLLTVVSYYQSYFPVSQTDLLSFTGFAFPYLWTLTLVVFIILLVSKSRISSVCSFIALAATFCGIVDIVHIVAYPSKSDNSIKILTFNIADFKSGGDGREMTIEGIRQLLEDEDADIVCLQEVCAGQWQDVLNKGSLGKMLGYRYFLYDRAEGAKKNRGRVAQAILSRYPIVDDEEIVFNRKVKSRMMAAKVTVRGETLRVVNCHLESNALSQDEIRAVSDAQHVDIDNKTEDNLKTTYEKLRRAQAAREEQVTFLADLIDKMSGPTVVCGDFNDIPTSNTYHRLTARYHDTFESATFTLGDTYNGSLPPIRIDYILHSDEFVTCDYYIIDKNLSDHFPVVAKVAL